MSKESDRKSPGPTLHEGEHRRDQSTDTKKHRPKFNLFVLIVIILVALVLIGFYAGLL